ncbi:MAG: PspC domain-containing protein, partial [Bacteroidota bacterium]
MNKIVSINLGGYPFTIDEDAYEHLNDYLQTIHHHFRLSEGYEEITADIESRMAELFQEKLAGRTIVTFDEVKSVIAIMGTPEDFGADPILEEAPKSSFGRRGGEGKPSWKRWKIKTGKRLFSNPEDKVIGGVCSGIAAYFGIQDPLWVRLIFVVFAITGGFAIPFYFILWAILPKAESASDRLAMRGEQANVTNIGKIIEEEFDHVSKKVSELGDEIEAKFNAKKKSGGNQSSFDEFRKDFSEDWRKSGGGQALRTAASEGISILGKVIMAVIQIIKAIVKPVLFALGIALIVLLALSWFGSVAALVFGYPFSSFLNPDASFMTVIGVVNVLMVIGIPLVMLIMFIMRVFMRTNFKPRYAAGL